MAFNVCMAETLTVHLGERSYSIQFGADLGAEVRAQVDLLQGQGRRLAIVTDENVHSRQGPALRTMFGALPTLALPPGEETKSLASLGRVLDFLSAQRLGRMDAIFAAGGGVIGDLAGFAAAAYLRGIDFYQVPTTLLAMVDSSVGGKTGVNLAAGKNLAGGVFVATGLLATLPAREFAAGMAEVIKCGLLGDADLFRQIERAALSAASAGLPMVIRRCCALKARVVEADERELAPEGGRALLNLGHTFGHAIEQATDYRRYLHGEAVGIGLVAAARLSGRLGLLPAAEMTRVEHAVSAQALPVRLAEPLPVAGLMAAMARDKKVRGGRLRLVVLRQLGEAVTRDDVAGDAIEGVWRDLGAN